MSVRLFVSVYSTNIPVLRGKGLAGFLRPMMLLVLKSSLSMLGWVCSWMALLVVLCSSSLTLGLATVRQGA